MCGSHDCDCELLRYSHHQINMTGSCQGVVFVPVTLTCQGIAITSMTWNISVSINCQGMVIINVTKSCQSVDMIDVIIKCQDVVLINVTVIVSLCGLHQYDYALSKCIRQYDSEFSKCGHHQ